MELRHTPAGSLELVDPALDQWFVRIEADPDPGTGSSSGGAVGAAALGALAREVPGLVTALEGLGGAYRVTFSSPTRAGLRDGTFRLMDTATGVRSVAVDATTGRFVEHGRVADQASSAVGVAQALATGAGIAAAIAQQRWLEETLGSITATVERIETRLRDAELALLDHADGLARTCWEALGQGGCPPQLTAELAACRPQVHAILGGRERWADRLLGRIDLHRDRKPEDSGPKATWNASIVKELEGGDVMGDLGLLVRALLSAGRVDAVTAVLIAEAGDGRTALVLAEGSTSHIKDRYHDLYRRFRPLARVEPELGRGAEVLARLPLVNRAAVATRAQETHLEARRFFADLDRTLGSALPDPDEQLSLQVAGYAVS